MGLMKALKMDSQKAKMKAEYLVDLMADSTVQYLVDRKVD